jgi:hypothetical protein
MRDQSLMQPIFQDCTGNALWTDCLYHQERKSNLTGIIRLASKGGHGISHIKYFTMCLIYVGVRVVKSCLLIDTGGNGVFWAIQAW